MQVHSVKLIIGLDEQQDPLPTYSSLFLNPPPPSYSSLQHYSSLFLNPPPSYSSLQQKKSNRLQWFKNKKLKLVLPTVTIPSSNLLPLNSTFMNWCMHTSYPVSLSPSVTYLLSEWTSPHHHLNTLPSSLSSILSRWTGKSPMLFFFNYFLILLDSNSHIEKLIRVPDIEILKKILFNVSNNKIKF